MWFYVGRTGNQQRNGRHRTVVLIVLYFIIKWAVKNGVKEAYRDISRKEKAGLDSGEEGSGFQERSVQNEL